MLKTHPIYSQTYNFLLATAHWKNLPLLRKIWFTLWNMQGSYKGLVSSSLHGKKVVLTNCHYYPLVNIWHPLFNQPLFALAHFMIQERKRNIGMIDVGAAVGDTVLMLEANFPGKFASYLCVDGDPLFFGFQEVNLASVSGKTKKVFSLLSDVQEMVGAIEKTNMTTGSALGAEKVQSRTLDQVVEEQQFGPVDLIKIDVDGFDGKVIGGARSILEKWKPGVVFEWNTPYFRKTGNDVLQPFEVLKELGYSRFVWFNNFGEFTHVQLGVDKESLSALDEVCEKLLPVNGFHYDVVALHDSTQVDLKAFVDFAVRARKTSTW